MCVFVYNAGIRVALCITGWPSLPVKIKVIVTLALPCMVWWNSLHTLSACTSLTNSGKCTRSITSTRCSSRLSHIISLVCLFVCFLGQAGGSLWPIFLHLQAYPVCSQCSYLYQVIIFPNTLGLPLGLFFCYLCFRNYTFWVRTHNWSKVK